MEEKGGQFRTALPLVALKTKRDNALADPHGLLD